MRRAGIQGLGGLSGISCASVHGGSMERSYGTTKEPVIPDAILDQLLARTEARSAFDSDGLLDQLKKALAERCVVPE
nr:hypothetical protein [Azorhizobium doebereinerae]